jgi:iron complex transport system substrate-binding protein
MPTRAFPLTHSPARIVSLVPSMTESLFELGMGDKVVGISDYCIYPADRVNRLPKVGGTKDARLENILHLQPDLVIANQEENSQETIRQIEKAGIPVWLTFPWTAADVLEDLWSLVGVCRSDAGARSLRVLEKMVEVARMATIDQLPLRYFCPIWEGRLADGEPWWMTFNGQTYSSDLLAILGGENVFAARQRRYPFGAEFGGEDEEAAGERDTRYPRVRLSEVIAAGPEWIVLPDEPYTFGEEDADTMRKLLESRLGTQIRVLRVEGSLITWPGTRIARALSELAPEFTA